MKTINKVPAKKGRGRQRPSQYIRRFSELILPREIISLGNSGSEDSPSTDRPEVSNPVRAAENSLRAFPSGAPFSVLGGISKN